MTQFPSRLAVTGRGADLAVVLGLVAFTWGNLDLAPQPGLDPSWLAGLYMAITDGLNFGSDLIFTYGPLGFLSSPRLYYPGLGVLSFTFALAIHSLLVVILLFVARRHVGRWQAIAVAYVGLAAARSYHTGYAEPLLTLVFVSSVLALQVIRRDRDAYLFAIASGVVAAVATLVKFNAGLATLALASLVSVAITRRRGFGLLAFLGAFSGAFLILWAATGQFFSDIDNFVSGSLSIAQGYSEAMGIEDPSRGGWEIRASFVAVGVLFLYVREDLSSWPSVRKWVGAAITLLFVTAVFKQGFVRHDVYHSTTFFISILIACIAFKPPTVLTLRVLAPAVLAGFLLGTLAIGPTTFLDPRPSLRRFGSQLLNVLEPSRRTATVTTTRDALRAHYQIDTQTLSNISGRTVHIYPWEASVAWAFPEIVWQPFPVMQSYSAYTTELDELNARLLSSGDGPERILRSFPAAIDGRNPTFESPSTNLAMLCNFSALSTSASWQVLQESPDRCGTPSEMGKVEASLDTWIQVPPSEDGVVYARIEGLNDGMAQRILTTMYKAPEWFIDMGSAIHRLVPGTAGGPLLMRIPSTFDYPAPFNLAAGTDQFRISARGSTPVDTIEVTFYEVPIEESTE